jgi:transcriptional regulator with XRE-family HTH domain
LGEDILKYREIGYRITIAREEAGFNQKDLAERLGISQATLSNYEKGKRRVYLPQLQNIANEVGKPLDYFLQPIDPVPVPDPTSSSQNEVAELLQIMSELSDLPREDRKTVVDYIRWLKSRGKENSRDSVPDE